MTIHENRTFMYFVHVFNRSGDNKTTFTWVDGGNHMTIISVDWIQKGKLKLLLVVSQEN